MPIARQQHAPSLNAKIFFYGEIASNSWFNDKVSCRVQTPWFDVSCILLLNGSAAVTPGIECSPKTNVGSRSE